ncbi:autotransporter outer membrane beta-barrel domain-containing protein [Alienimonas californiensis]|uniref:Extracellular serine protease n=1 Tax=Alienimonas californiensis TaxID=2527989 RepID=A0A517P8E5_9PLAN|nr:autotransporter outer membrane beta-barrel domain-containing protein [Alienimonas californiensis]QDT15644.1 Extracellular serine protease precursor [Alienimonas californiensis]
MRFLFAASRRFDVGPTAFGRRRAGGPAGIACAALALAAPAAPGQETHSALTISAGKTVTDAYAVTGGNPLGLDLLVTGPSRTAAPTTFAEALGTTVSGGVFEIEAGASAALAGVSQTSGTTVFNGSAETAFSYTDGAAGPTVTTLADYALSGGALDVNAGGSLKVGTFAISGLGQADVFGTLDAETVTHHASSTFNVGTSQNRTGAVRANTVTASKNVFIYGSLEAATYVQTGGTTGVAGTLDADVYQQSGGSLTVANGGSATIGELLVSGGTVWVLGGGNALRVTDRLHMDGRLDLDAGAAFTLDPGAVLSGSGTFDTATPWLLGTVAPGNSPGTMTFLAGVTTNAATRLEIELVPTTAPVAGTDNDLVAVTGTATIDGGTVVAQRWGAGTFVGGTEYTFLTADNLVVNQAFNVVSDVVGVGFDSAFTSGASGDYRLIVTSAVTPAAVAELGGSVNQRAVGAALNGLGSGPLIAAFNGAPNEAAQRNLLSDLSGELYGSYLTSQANDALRFFDLVSAQAFGPPWSCANCGTAHVGLTGWMAGYGAGGRVNGDGNARGVETGLGGTALGLNRCFDETFSAGLFYGYENSTTRVPGADSSLTADVHRVGLWTRTDLGALYFRTQNQVAFGDAESRRGFDAGLDPVAGQFDSRTSATELEAGRRLGDRSAYFVPALGLRYVTARLDDFTESGGPAALAVETSTLSALRARLGFHSGAALPTRLPATATLSAFYERDLNASSVGDVDAAFANPAGTVSPAFTARGTDFGRDRLILGPGVVLGDGPVTVVTDYRAGLTESSVEHAGGVRLEVCY